MQNLVFDPQWAHICAAKELRIEFLALTYPFMGTSNHFVLPQEVTCFHMSHVICQPSWINLNLYLYIELSWIWIVTFLCLCKFYLWRKTWFSTFFFLKYHVYTLNSHRLQCWTENILKMFGNISASLNFEFNFWFFHSVVFEFETEIFPGSAIFGLDLGYFQNFFTFLNQAFKT